MTRRIMQDLPRGARFIGPDEHTEYEVVLPAAVHEDGWVEVRDLSLTDAQVQRLLDTPGAVEAGCGPRDGVFMTGQTSAEVEVLS